MPDYKNPPRSLRTMVTADPPEGMGLCCVYGFLALEDLRMKARPEKRLTAAILEHKTGFTNAACNNTLSNWRKGKITCQKYPYCVLVKTGIKAEELPQWSPEHLAFLKLQGQAFDVWRTKPTLEKIGPEPIRGRIIYRSNRSDWLWIGISLEYSPITVKLGDQLMLADDLWGTVMQIDGNIYYLLLPGEKHGLRNVVLRTRAGDSPAHLAPNRDGHYKDED